MMKKAKKYIAGLIIVALFCAVTATLAACGGYKVTYVLPEGVTGSAPAAETYAQYEEFTLPEAKDASRTNAKHVGWKDAAGNFYENGSTFKMGGSDITLTAVFEADEIVRSSCANPGTMNFGGRLIGPTPAYTRFYADKTWIADAEGVAAFSHFEGTWDISGAGALSMKLIVQDGVTRNTDIEITSALDGKAFSYTLTHPGDRGGTKSHVNYISKYHLIKGYNETQGTSVALPSEPNFTITFAKNSDDATGEITAVSGKLGQSVTLPSSGFTREGYKLTGWTMDALSEWTDAGFVFGAGSSFTITSNDLTATAVWTAE